MNWYLNKGLADKIGENPPTIKLKFQPAGEGDSTDPYMLADKANRCVVCGVEADLTRHHVVPYCYRIHFPDDLKSHSSYDVLPLCIECHEGYEVHARDFRKQILNELKIAEHGDVSGVKIDLSAVRAIKAANALLRHNNKIPEDKTGLLRDRIRTFLNKTELTDEDINATAKLEWKVVPENHTCASKKIVESQSDLDSFARRWRCHFIAYMNPRYMPEYWDVNRKFS